ncbi:helix-turn-helix domain-containing protein [Gibbsiella quercinecans]|nr:helix-turn-helix domain-containing protein [Gibbsiella quercinecans]
MQRLQFVTACLKGDTSVAELCRRFNISRKTGYKQAKNLCQVSKTPSVL